MPTQPGSMNYTQGFGSSPNSVSFPHLDVRAPTITDVMYPIGKRWLDTVLANEYVLGNFTSSNGVTIANWIFLGSAAGDLNTLTADNAVVVSPTAGDINITGDAVQGVITTGSNAPGSLEVSVVDWTTAQKGVGVLSTNAQAIAGTGTTQAVTPAALNAKLGTQTIHGVLIGGGSSGAVVALTAGSTGTVLTGVTGSDPIFSASPSVTGSLTAGTTVTAALGAITATNGNLVLGTAGNKIVSTSVATTTAAGANSFGTVTLVGGTATVATSAITTNSIVMLTRQTIGATGATPIGLISRGAIVNGVSFVINSLSSADATALVASDVSNIGWMIIN